MKRMLLILSVFSLCASWGVAGQAAPDERGGSGKSATIRVSYFAPEGAKEGITIGGSVGRIFDGVVELSLGTDVYYRHFEQNSEVATSIAPDGTVTTTEQRLVEYNTIDVPIMVELSLRIPLFWKLAAYGHGGLGYEFLFNKESDYTEGVSDLRFYSGLTWTLGAGAMIRLGRDSLLYVEGFYDHSTPKRNLDDLVEGLPAFESVDFSGFGVRVGVALGPF